jgi:hypothetical protein
MSLLRRKKKQSPLARLLQLWAIVRLGIRVQRAYRRGYLLLRGAAFLAITGVVIYLVRRRRASRRSLESQFTYAPPPSPSVSPGPPPLDASPNGTATTTETELDLSAEKQPDE